MRRFVQFEAVVMRQACYVDCAAVLDYLRKPPGNRPEALKGKRKRQHSIHVNDQFRICFCWTAAGPTNVEIVDYH